MSKVQKHLPLSLLLKIVENTVCNVADEKYNGAIHHTEEMTPKSKNDEIVVFKSFFQASLCLPMHPMVATILNKMKFTCIILPLMKY